MVSAIVFRAHSAWQAGGGGAARLVAPPQNRHRARPDHADYGGRACQLRVHLQGAAAWAHFGVLGAEPRRAYFRAPICPPAAQEYTRSCMCSMSCNAGGRLDVGPEKPLAPLVETGRQLGAARENVPKSARTTLLACGWGRPGASTFVSNRGVASCPHLPPARGSHYHVGEQCC